MAERRGGQRQRKAGGDNTTRDETGNQAGDSWAVPHPLPADLKSACLGRHL